MHVIKCEQNTVKMWTEYEYTHTHAHAHVYTHTIYRLSTLGKA